MRSRWLASAFFGATILTTTLAWGVTLEQAQRDPRLEISVTSEGYTSLRIHVRNNSGVALELKDGPGTVLKNDDETEQDLTFSVSFTMQVGPGQTSDFTVGSYCLQEHRETPSQAHFTARGFDKLVASVVRPRARFRASEALQSVLWERLNSRSQSVPPAERLPNANPTESYSTPRR